MAKSVLITKQFKRDIKKHTLSLVAPQWIEVMNCLINGLPMPARYANHPLKGEWQGCMDCHIKPDLVLIYELMGDNDLLLHRLGSHSELSIA
ncbi:type II toxin-antitoxin system YafQ family toxin [Moraxella sp. ZY210820]|uniref:type II toxin-antitoxin system YafQ family toxin n=1 Tax=unclassified Moraxella TaxID=2685852 RepID=UPI00272FF088|nr:type II toxin-antitoxin system YafQ family toxin [Moraxella sp. ZY210820]WLF84565.1 type II toxin-antitoxin system YafQ family toxin [Moraxella sp. ZY210820]